VENQPVAMKKKNGWKIASTAMIILLVVGVAKMGFLIWKNLDQQSQINSLNDKVKQLDAEKAQVVDEEVSTNVKSDTEITNQRGALLVQLETAFPKGSTNMGGPATIGGTIDVQYRANGYASARADATISNDGGGYSAKFYKADNDAGWKYFIGTQTNLLCSDYNTDDIRKAFIADECHPNDESVELTTVGNHYRLWTQE
jgi:hypothetical protein